MIKLYYIFCITFLVLVCSVSASLFVNQTSFPLIVNKGQNYVYSINLFNNNSFSIQNVSFTPLSYFSFPVIPVMSPFERRDVSFSVQTQAVFSSSFVSTLSYFYSLNVSPLLVSYDVVVGNDSFSPDFVSLMSGDSVVFHNLFNRSIDILDLDNSGFSSFSISPFQNISRLFSSVDDYFFYASPDGFTGRINVSQRLGTSLAHDSSTDRQLIFFVNSVLPSDTLQFSVLSNNVSLGNNQSLTGVLQVRNTQGLNIFNIHLSADRWISAFSENDFDLSGGQNKIITFNLTPFVSSTVQTNRSHIVTFSLSSSNAGNSSDLLYVFIPYQNMDLLNINGTTYSITLLGINDTINACIQHLNDAGFEACQRLADFFKTNVTVIKEIEAQYKVGESDFSKIISQLQSFGDVATRGENKANLYMDRQNDVNSKVDSVYGTVSEWKKYMNATLVAQQERIDRNNRSLWSVVTAELLLCLLFGLSWIVQSLQYINYLEEAGQI